MQIELPDDVVKFMRDLAREIEMQDNRATASPYFYVVQSKDTMIAPDGYGDGDTQYYCSDRSEAHTKEQWAEIIAEENKEEEGEEGFNPVDLEDFLDDECRAFGTHYYDREENVFLTEKGYKQHMELNAHNYRYYKETYSYVKFAFRNPEMEGLLKAIKAFSTKVIT
jgi:hypothetical protein